MPDCFISYSTQDQRIADIIYAELRAQNLDIFLAPVSIDAGENWRDRLRNTIKNSLSVIYLASKASNQSPEVYEELGMASDKKIIPVLLDISPAELRTSVNLRQAIDFRGKSDKQKIIEIRKIVEILKEIKSKGALSGESAALLKQGIRLLEALAFEEAIEVFAIAIKAEPLAPATNYYFALASLRGTRPSRRNKSEIDRICQHLERACRFEHPQAHYFYLLALIKYDFCSRHGFKIPYDDIGAMISEAENYPVNRTAVEEMFRLTGIEDTPVDRYILEKLNS